MHRAPVARIVGLVLVLAFLSLDATSNGLKITFHDTQTTSSPGELNFWLGHAFLLFPASLLIGYGIGAWLGALIEQVVARLRGLTVREHRIAIIVLTCLAFALARIGRAVFLIDFPITDDEYAVEFGGRVLASGHLMVRLPLLREAIPDLFLLFRNGAVGSFDWPGGVAIAGFAEATRLRTLAWTAVAVAPLPILVVLMTQRIGRAWGYASAAIFLLSPMALLMSMTTHAQLASRALFAGGLLALHYADRGGGLRRWTIVGLIFGLAFLCRPMETAFFCLPIAVWAARQTIRREASYGAALPGMALGIAVGASLMLWHSYGMTGSPLLPARFANPANTDIMSSSLWTRFGDNLTYNVLMLGVWFLGPLGLVLVACGMLADRFTRLLGACVVTDLALALFHDNPGLHVVGPIHYSECAVPLTIMATYGLFALVTAVRQRQLDVRVTLSMVAVPLTLGLGIFTIVQGSALRQQADIQRTVYEVIERAAKGPHDPKAVILTPWFFGVTSAIPAMRDIGSWVHDWRRPQIDLSDDVMFLRDVRGAEGVLAGELPGRRFFRLTKPAGSRYLTLVPLAGGDPIPLPDLGEVDR